MDIKTKAEQARGSSGKLASTLAEERNAALRSIAQALEAEGASIDAANKADLEAARETGLAAPLLKRLKFDAAKRADCIAGIASLISLPDPVGVVQKRTELSPGLELTREACPIGVVGIIFESRPDALVQISTLCLKSGNGCLLKGGSEARNTNRRLYEVISGAAASAGMPAGWMQLLETREDVGAMLALDEYIDLLIPRGSNAFVRHIMEIGRAHV